MCSVPSENGSMFWQECGMTFENHTFDPGERDSVIKNLDISQITARNWGWADELEPTYRWALMIYFKPPGDIITTASLFTSWEACGNPTSIFSSLFSLSRSLGTVHNTAPECQWRLSQLWFPTFNTSPLTASGSILFPWKGKRKQKRNFSFVCCLLPIILALGKLKSGDHKDSFGYMATPLSDKIEIKEI